MRDQYTGDVSDFFKYHFIRSIAGDKTVAVAWFYVPTHDGRNDGNHIEWWADPRFKECDSQLAVSLSALKSRTIQAVESCDIWPRGTRFHREPVPTMTLRSKWSAAKRESLSGCDFVFCDPDNGIGFTNKHVLLDEISQLRRAGRSVAFITFPARVKHDLQVAALHDRLHAEAGASTAITVRTSISIAGPNGKQPRARWFTVLDGDLLTHKACRLFGERLQRVLGAKIQIHETTAR
jgi:hypothetical protein